MNTYTKEQKDAWDKVPTNKGLIEVFGDAGFDYLCHRLKRMILFEPEDQITTLIIGDERERARLLQKMVDEGVIDLPEIEPTFFSFQERTAPDGEEVSCCLNSEDDTERFCDFIRHAKTNKYHRVGAVVILCPYYEGKEEKYTKHLNMLLKVPVWRGSVIEKNIEVPVFVYSDTDGWSDFAKPSNSTTPSGVKRTIDLIRGDEVVLESVEWLVPEFIVENAPNVLSGEMDTRKSTLAVDIATAGSIFRPWFMGTENEHRPFITLFAGAEDSYSTTVMPRFLAAGGNPDCIYCVKLDVRNERQTADGLQTWETPLSLDEHIELLREQIQFVSRTREWPVGLLICDPIISFFGNKNYNSPQDARDIMSGLKKLCEQEQITIINICHFNKTQGLTAKQKTAGSKALIEAHRMAWAFDLEEDDPKTTLIAPIKHNLLKEARSYKITTVDKDGVGVIKFAGYSTKTADDRIEEKESKDRGSRKEIKKAILATLKDGPIPPGQVCNVLQDFGVSSRTIRRAAEGLEEEGKLRKSGTNSKSFMWELVPEAEQATVDEVTTNGSL